MEKNLGGRPKTDISVKTFEGLCSINCTKDEMCGIFDCDEKTLTRWCKDTYGLGFSDVYKKKSASGKASLRRMQFKAAESGNVTMQIWLGKQYLEQKDKQDIEHSGETTVNNRHDVSHLSVKEIKELLGKE